MEFTFDCLQISFALLAFDFRRLRLLFQFGFLLFQRAKLGQLVADAGLIAGWNLVFKFCEL
jgi:hypothetical protein